MSLNETPEVVTFPETHYLFIEKIGSFMNTAPQAWKEIHGFAAQIAAHNEIKGYMSLYNVEKQIYRAGVCLAKAAVQSPEGVHSMLFKGGRYYRFTYTGSYANLPAVSARTFAIVKEKKLPLRQDFHIENYPNDPKTTPESELITEIYFPAA